MSSIIGGGRPLRVCDACGGVDDAPRHTVVGADPGAEPTLAPSDEIVDRVLDLAPRADRARLIRDLQDTTSTERHLDCCRERGCTSCAERTAGAEDLRDADLLAHLESAMEG